MNGHFPAALRRRVLPDRPLRADYVATPGMVPPEPDPYTGGLSAAFR